MHTVELLQEALETVRQCGYEVRQDWLGGEGGGHCLVRGRKWLLLDMAQSADEQLDVVADALRAEPAATHVNMSSELVDWLDLRDVA